MFLIILPGVIGQDAEKIAERIIKGILNTNITLLDGREVKVGVSAGIVSTMRISVATEVATLIQHAIEAVAHAKRDGGNQSYMVFV
jgi:GGDEF domain-containing protein